MLYELWLCGDSKKNQYNALAAYLFFILGVIIFMNSIQLTQQLGQQIWLDNLSRTLITSGVLAEKIQEGVSGITTNPAIFLNAIEQDASYQQQLNELKKTESNAKTRYEMLAIADVQAACDELSYIYQKSNGNKGFVSIEVDPSHAHDSEKTVEEALRLYRAIARENVMIKVPATEAGIAALTQLLAQGLSVNMTLIFSLSTLDKIYAAYMQGLAACAKNGLPYQRVRAVASVFLSRIDTAVDKQLPENLQGKTALSLAKVAYARWQTFFKQYNNQQAIALLWASTGTKNPHYSDVLYVEEVIGQSTVNTVPEKTLAAFLHHGCVQPTLTENVATAQQQLDVLQKHHVDLDDVAITLQDVGLKQFCDAFANILKAV